MAGQTAFSYSRSFFYRIWLTVCLLIVAATAASSILVYLNVVRQLRSHIEQSLLWEAHFYSQQLEQVLLRAAQNLDGMVHSSAAVSGSYPLLQREMNNMHLQNPSIIRSWLAYPDGTLIPSPSTRPDYVRELSWWHDYLSAKTPGVFMGYLMGRSQSMVGKPFIDDSSLTTIVPLLSVDLEGTRIVRAAGAQVDLNAALTDFSGVDVDWSEIPVSVYTNDGILVVSPYRYTKGHLKISNRRSDNPLVRMMLAGREMQGFGIYDSGGREMAGLFLRLPSLGMVLTVEYPASEVVDPVHRVAYGPLLIAALLLLIATVLTATFAASTKRLRKAEQLARSAEVRALQAHINPHFLFNTLDCLAGLTVSTGNAKLLRMTRSLISIFRYTTRNPGAMVTLEEELQYLQEYVSIQEIRYGARFAFDLLVPDELRSIAIPKFCLQPLVENCFVHGVEKSLDPVSIVVSVIRSSNDMEICVSDNGPGISPARLEEINRYLVQETYEPESLGGVGLSNIHHRLRYAYGLPYGIRIEARRHGLAVHLRLPLIGREQGRKGSRAGADYGA